MPIDFKSVTYTAILTQEDGVYSMNIPDICGYFTCADTFEEGIKNFQ